MGNLPQWWQTGFTPSRNPSACSAPRVCLPLQFCSSCTWKSNIHLLLFLTQTPRPWLRPRRKLACANWMTKGTAPQNPRDFFIFNVYRAGNKYRKRGDSLKRNQSSLQTGKIVSKSCFELATIPEMRSRVTIMGITEDQQCHKAGWHSSVRRQNNHTTAGLSLIYTKPIIQNQWGVSGEGFLLCPAVRYKRYTRGFGGLVPLPNIHQRVSTFGKV